VLGRRWLSGDENKDKEGPLDILIHTREVEIRMPDLAEGDNKIVEWFKSEGDVVRRGDVICDIETSDFTFGMEIDDEKPSFMGKICVEAPSEAVKDHEIICVLLHKEKVKPIEQEPIEKEKQ
jgi:pyruvate/2-oxoglutarate dehydrogenase complex dihydrolipoamide acyltransferase (E2) component